MRGIVIGAGPAGLMAAEIMARGGMTVSIYERMPSPARKFLMAGRGGLNLTHSEAFPGFLMRYGGAAERLQPILEAFPPAALRQWAEDLGEPTFVGSSGRVFPRSFKTSPLLRAWLRRLDALGVRMERRMAWRGWDDVGRLRLQPHDPSETERRLNADAVVLALGGGSWPQLGSDGHWVPLLTAQGITVAPLEPANCGIVIPWSDHVRSHFAGVPLKRIVLRLGDHVVAGEAMVTTGGLEGGAVYALLPAIRAALAHGPVPLAIDLRPDLGLPELVRRLSKPRDRQSMANHLRKAAGLSPVASALLREAGALPSAPVALAERIRALTLSVQRIAGIERAISSAGGVSWSEVDATLMLRKRPGTFVAGEMLDWEAPTGGYLLQAVLASGVTAGRGALQWATSPMVTAPGNDYRS